MKTQKAKQRLAAGGAATIAGISEEGLKTIEMQGSYAEVPGRQTVLKAELCAAILDLTRAHVSEDVTISIDAAYITNGWLKRDLELTVGDVWIILFIIIKVGREQPNCARWKRTPSSRALNISSTHA